MQPGSLKNIHPFSAILVSFIFAFICVIFISIIGGLIPVLFLKVSPADLFTALSDFSDPSHIAILKYFQILQSLGLFVIPAFFLGVLFFERGIRQFGFNVSITSFDAIAIILIVIVGAPLVNGLSVWNQGMQLPGFLSGLENKLKLMEENAAVLTGAFLRTKTLPGLGVNLLMIAIIPAVGEELFFRGLIQRFLVKWTRKPWLGILLAAFLFSFMHFQFYGFIPRMYLGLVFGLIYFWTGSIWLPMLAHFLNNGTAVMLYFFYGQEFVEQKTDTLGATQDTWYLSIISLALVIFLLWNIFKEKQVLQRKN